MSGLLGIYKKNGYRFLFLLLVMVFFSGCGAHGMARAVRNELHPKEEVSVPAALPEKPLLSANMNHEREKEKNGSLWDEGQSRSFFFQDAKASHVGDIVTVRVVENAKGTKEAGTKTDRSSTLSASTASFLGVPMSTVNDLQVGANFSNAFDGDGSTSRSGSLTADVTAMVTGVYPNGNMVIEGQREVLINHEKEFLSVSGIIRPQDIQQGNTVLSTVIADARIEYSGSGVVSEKQRPGWLARMLDFVWPF